MLECYAARCSVLGVLLAACATKTDDSAARVAELEAKVQTLEARLGALATPGFQITCLASWRVLGAVGDAAWACRNEQPAADGFWPNCNVVESSREHDAATGAPLSAQQAFEASLSDTPQLEHARRISDRPTQLDREPAHEAVYEHDLLSKPLRVLATVAVHGDRTYAVSCASPPEDYAAYEVSFRQITNSFRFKR
jgi:hypothetical protein